ncbi:MAG: hypothetical protein ABJN65_01150, partial [Parasphingorhabdus sp.]
MKSIFEMTQFFAVLIVLMAFGIASSATAQTNGGAPPVPVRSAIDENGVDVVRGTFNYGHDHLSIGADGKQGLSYATRQSGSTSATSHVTTLHISGNTATFTVDGVSDTFVNGVSTEGNGSSYIYSSPLYTYTSSDGTVTRFVSNSSYNFFEAATARALDTVFPDGTKRTYNHKIVQYCAGGYELGVCQSVLQYALRLQSVNNSNGYQLKFNYALSKTSLVESEYYDWSRLTSIKALNNAVEYCNPTLDYCSTSQNWPTSTITNSGGATTITDAEGQQTRYTGSPHTGVFKIKRPGSTTDNVTATHDVNNRVTSLLRDGLSYTYAYSDSGNTRTTTRTDPASKQRVYTSDLTTFRITLFKDELNRQTSYTYDSNGRVKRVTLPEGNYAEYTYDARGNVTNTTRGAKSGSGTANIVTTASYPASCSNKKTCNKPTWTRDATGKQTDYTYNSSHGGVLTVTQPAPSSGAARPQTRVSYSAKQAYFKNSTGSIVASGQSTQMPTQIASCRTASSCSGGTDETKTVINYGSQTAGVANNLLPVSATASAGNGTLAATSSFTFDNWGNQLTVDGPLTGTADTSRTRYDDVRRVVGVTGADPDGVGLMQPRAQRFAYNADGQMTKFEIGTVTNQTDAAWNAFSVLETVTSTYDGNARKTRDALTTGATTQAVAQYSYDNMSRLQCRAQRMNMASLPTNACALGTAGLFGSDRIVKNIYDAAGQVTKVQNALGTSDQVDEIRTTFNNNGTTATVKDGKGNLTSYTYDGHDRLLRTKYPSKTVAGTSSATDYEQLAYNTQGNVSSQRRRNGQTIYHSYDNLGRATLKNLPGTANDVHYSYDLQGRQLTARLVSSGGLGLTNAYDALGRLTSVTDTTGGGSRTTSYLYDTASRRTRMTYSDGYYVAYEYKTDGWLYRLRENGSGILATYAYDANGRRTSLTYGNGAVTNYAYDAASRLASLTSNLSGTANDLTTTFGYNPASQLSQLTRSNDSYAWTGHYNVDRNYTVNGLNQLTTAGALSLSYDTNGNLTSDGTNSYTYDNENRLITGTGGVTLTYDPYGRLAKTTGTATTRMGYDGADL